MSQLLAHAIDPSTGKPHYHEEVEENPSPRNPITANHTLAWSVVAIVVLILVVGVLIKNPFRTHTQ